jgi:hypothetical protein
MIDSPPKSAEALRQSGRAAVAHYLGWPISDVSIQGLKWDHPADGARADGVAGCRLGLPNLPKQTQEDILRSILYTAGALAAEYLFDVETELSISSRIMDQLDEDAARAFPNDRKRQRAMIKTGVDTAFEIVRGYRPGIEALAAALVRLERVSGATAEQLLSRGLKNAPHAGATSSPRGQIQGWCEDTPSPG